MDYLIYKKAKKKKMGGRGISNYQIENAIANIGDDDLTNNLWVLFRLTT